MIGTANGSATLGPTDLTAYRSELLDSFAELSRVLPVVVAEGKNPGGAMGTGWQNQRLTIDDAERLLRKVSHPALGIKLGPGGAIDFDIDGPDELIAFAELFDGAPPVLAAYTSGREGGEHRLAAYDDRLAATGAATIKYVATGGQSITVRVGCKRQADGSLSGAQSIVPCSFHCASDDNGKWHWTGKRYAWKPSLSLDDVGLVKLDDVIIDRLLAAHFAKHKSTSSKSTDSAASNGDGYKPGTRHDHLCSLAGTLRNRGCDRATIAAALHAENQQKCKPPKPDAEIESIADYYATADTRDDGKSAEFVEKPAPPLRRFTLAELCTEHPTLHPPVVDGLYREGETVNIIAASKFGKSWLSYGLALSIVTGRSWLDTFSTRSGKVLLIDNELHKPTLANRIPRVAEAMGISIEQVDLDFEIISLRGDLRTLAQLQRDLDAIEPHEFKCIIFDAWYRFTEPDKSENDNAQTALAYNTLDRIAERTKSALVVIHHSSKGKQGDKRVTDVGSGAGAMSRAADAHLVLRDHADEGVVILDGAVRSFPPVDPVALTYEYPVWRKVGCNVDVTDLADLRTPGEAKRKESDAAGMKIILGALAIGPATKRKLRADLGIGPSRLERLLGLLVHSGDIAYRESSISGNQTEEYYLVDFA